MLRNSSLEDSYDWDQNISLVGLKMVQEERGQKDRQWSPRVTAFGWLQFWQRGSATFLFFTSTPARKQKA